MVRPLPISGEEHRHAFDLADQRAVILAIIKRIHIHPFYTLTCERQRDMGRNGESGFSVRPNHPDRTYRRGEKFAVEIIPPSNGLDYLYLAYMNSAGEIAQLYPGPGLDGKIRPGEKTISLGSGGEMTIGEPYGQDLLIALASDAPIAPRFADQPNVAQNFLGALKRALSGGSSAMNVESRLVFIKTGP